MFFTIIAQFILAFSEVLATPMVNLFIEQEGVPRLVSSQTNNLEEPLYLEQPFSETKYDLHSQNGCDPISSGSEPYFWRPLDKEWNTYLQFDFATLHFIQRITQFLYVKDGDDSNNFFTKFTCRFSEDGLVYTTGQDCHCSWSGNEQARLIRIYPHDDWLGADDPKKISSFFLVGGSEIANPESFAFSHVNSITAGFQARLSLNVINPAIACDDSLQVDAEKGSEVIMQNGVALDMEGAIHYKVYYLEEYQKCLVLLMIEAFQFSQSALYSLEISGGYKKSGQMELPFDPRESYYHVDIYEGHFFVTMVDFPPNLSRDDPDHLIKVKEACYEEKGADVLSEYFANQFQAIDTNFFLQSMIYNKWNAKIGVDVSDKVYLYLRDSVKEICTFVNSSTGLMEFMECSGFSGEIVGIFCYFYDAEINFITVEPNQCTVENSEEKEATVTYRVSPLITGSRESREITCQAWDDRGLVLRGRDESFELFKDEVAVYSVLVNTLEVLAKIECYAGRRKNDTVFIAIKGIYELEKSHDELKFISTDQTPVYLDETDYGAPYDIVVQSIGYLMGYFSYSFQEPYGDWTLESSDAVTEYFYTCDGPHLKVRAVGTLHFLSLSPISSGLYRFFMQAGGELKQIQSEFIHPFKIKCSPVCQEEIFPGQDVELDCEVDHHLFTDPSLFESAADVNVSMKFWKTEYFDDIPGYNQLNPCEYTNKVESSLTYDLSQINRMRFDKDQRKVYINFGILSTQPWNIGWYYLAVTPLVSENCYLFGSAFNRNCELEITNPVVPTTCDSSKSVTKTDQYLLFFINNNMDVGIITPRPRDNTNPRALYLTYDTRLDNRFQFYYRILPIEGSQKPRDVCAQDGGTFVDDQTDPVVSTILNNLNEIQVNLFVIDLTKFWSALTCNYYTNPMDPSAELDASDGDFVVEKADNRNLLVFIKFDPTGFHKIGFTDTQLAGLCKYQRGRVWDIFADPGECLYKPLDLNIGLKQTVGAMIHGSASVDILCEALPPGSYQNKSFTGLSGPERFAYEVPFPEESDVQGFRCIQLLNDSLSFEVDWVELGFESTFVDLKVDDFIEPLDYWCRPTKSSLTQPCFGSDVSLKACVVGNPFKNCSWNRLYPTDDNALVMGERGVSWEFFSEEDPDPQCHSTKRCYYLRFQNLDYYLHSGLYYLKCYSGIEGSEAETPLRTQTRFFNIQPHSSAPIGANPITYNVTCSPGKTEAQIVVYGQIITANVWCSGSENGFLTPTVTNFSPGTFVVNFVIPQVDQTTECRVNTSNMFGKLTSLVITDKIGSHKIWDSVYIEEISRSKSELSFCCKSCGLNIEEKHLKLLCVLSHDDSVLVGYKDAEFWYDTKNNIGEQCVSVSLPQGTFVCTCTLFREHVATTIFYRDGQVRNNFVSAPRIVVQPQPEYVNETTKPPSQRDETTSQTSSTTTAAENDVTVKLTKNELRILMEMAALEEIVQTKSQIHYKTFSDSMDTILGHVEPRISKQRGLYILSILETLQAINLTANITNATNEQLTEMAQTVLSKGLKLLEGIASNCPSLVKDETTMINMLAMFENFTHWAMSHTADGIEVSLTTESSRVVAFRLGEDLSWAKEKTFTCSRVDMNGVTKNTIQGGYLFTHDVLASAQPANTIAMYIFDWLISAANQRLRAWPQNTALNGNRYRITNKLFKRESDLFIASLRDSNGRHLPAGANYSMNNKEIIPNKSSKGPYTTSSTFKCAFWDPVSKRFIGENNTDHTFLEPYRMACQSLHTTTFAVVAEIDQVKEDEIQLVSYHYVSFYGFIFATLVAASGFCFIFFHLEEMSSVSAVAHLIYFACFNIYLIGYLLGGDQTDNNFRCYLSQIVSIFGISISMGGLNNILLGQFLEIESKHVDPREVYFVYFFNILGLPSLHLVVVMLVFHASIGDFYSCFPGFCTIQSAIVLSVPIATQLLVAIVISFRIREESNKLAEMLEEELASFAITANNRNPQILLIANVIVFVGNAFAWSQENFYAHLGSAFATAALSLLTVYRLIVNSSEIQEVISESKSLKIPEPRKKKRPRNSAANTPNPMMFDEVVTANSKTTSISSQISSVRDFLKSRNRASSGESNSDSTLSTASDLFMDGEKTD